MKKLIPILFCVVFAAPRAGLAQVVEFVHQPDNYYAQQPGQISWATATPEVAQAGNADWIASLERSLFASDVFPSIPASALDYIIRGQSPDDGTGLTPDDPNDDPNDHPNGTGTGLAEHHPSVVHKNNTQMHPHSGGVDPTDPTAILTQIQLQNNFGAQTYNASGYANTFVFQPVLPFPVAMPGLKKYFPFHIVRPTLPFPAPTADPDGPRGVQGGMGDLTILDVGIHPTSWGNIALGYSLIAPTATHPQLGLQEWQFGPTAGLVYKKVPKTLLGFVTQIPFSLESNAKQIDLQIIAVRHLPNQWYLRWGDTFSTFNIDTGAYNIPIQPAIGKVVKKGLFGVPNNIFFVAEYTPPGLRSGTGGAEWNFKLNVTLLFPETKLNPLLGFLWNHSSHCCCCE